MTFAALEYYSRHLMLPEIGSGGQEKLGKAKVLVVGAGGLGCPILTYLALAGVGTIGIIDGDVVSASNLHRQFIFTTDDIGKSKSLTASAFIRQRNPFINIEPINELFSVANATEIVSSYDLLIDGSDNFGTRYLVNDACVLGGKPFISGAVMRFSGQVSAFNVLAADGSRGPTYRCLFPNRPALVDSPPCSTAGVLGMLPGIIGSICAVEAIKLLLNIGENLSGKLLTLDALGNVTRYIKYTIDLSQPPIAEFRPNDYKNEECIMSEQVKEISAVELKALLSEDSKVTLVDVREPPEKSEGDIGGILIPLGTLNERFNEIPKDHTVVIYCRSGGRSKRACEALQARHGYQNLVNLKGGILGWNEATRS